jgi:hypothetical protein
LYPIKVLVSDMVFSPVEFELRKVNAIGAMTGVRSDECRLDLWRKRSAGVIPRL